MRKGQSQASKPPKFSGVILACGVRSVCSSFQLSTLQNGIEPNPFLGDIHRTWLEKDTHPPIQPSNHPAIQPSHHSPTQPIYPPIHILLPLSTDRTFDNFSTRDQDLLFLTIQQTVFNLRQEADVERNVLCDHSAHMRPISARHRNQHQYAELFDLLFRAISWNTVYDLVTSRSAFTQPTVPLGPLIQYTLTCAKERSVSVDGRRLRSLCRPSWDYKVGGFIRPATNRHTTTGRNINYR